MVIFEKSIDFVDVVFTCVFKRHCYYSGVHLFSVKTGVYLSVMCHISKWSLTVIYMFKLLNVDGYFSMFLNDETCSLTDVSYTYSDTVQ